MITLPSTRSGRRSVAALAILVAAALGAAGCGGDDETSSQAQWASDVCGPVADWKGSITTIATDFSGGISKDVITQKINDAQQATTEMVERAEVRRSAADRGGPAGDG